jgi:hypothetical protein
METKVNICDECKKQVVEDKCKICEKDICKKCRTQLMVLLKINKTSYDNERTTLGACFVCKSCKKNIKILTKKEHNEIIQKIADYIKNEFVIMELETNGGQKQGKN